MLYMKSCELKNLGIDAAVVFEELSVQDYLRETVGEDWHCGCYIYTPVLDTTFFIEDMEPKYHSPIGSLLRVYPTSKLHCHKRPEGEPPCYEVDIPF